MQYLSTRGYKDKFSAAAAIEKGIAQDGGLFVPEYIPTFAKEELQGLILSSYEDRAVAVLKKYLTDYTEEELREAAKEAYKKNDLNNNVVGFSSEEPAPLVKLKSDKAVLKDLHILELFHGPTSAFKDMALQILPHLLTKALEKTGEKSDVVILVATSGDTGKAALEGFRDVERIKIIVFYPEEGVSDIQKLQMLTQEGNNVEVIAVRGNFDDAQNGVKEIFTSEDFNQELLTKGYKLSSANSINWGRLVPQIVYYFSAYLDLVKNKEIELGEKVNFSVPTGNFGNILALYYAKLMGLPVGKLICASNKNNILTDFLKTGVYDRNRHFYKTYSPSMDILISSNLERLLYQITKEDTSKVAELMESLKTEGKYAVEPEYLKKIQEDFFPSWADDEKTLEVIEEEFADSGYPLDPHTAVAFNAAKEYRKATADFAPLVVVSTASPYKFSDTVLNALDKNKYEELKTTSEFAILKALFAKIKMPVPFGLANLENQNILHKKVCNKEEMKEFVLQSLV
ncbi:threonine synthase [Selenomonadales bacterium OttesenSCG-928-I06]|nr:threonine synthase [Selenomonadales bacterium OttesenSCG-928-I06]